MACLVTLNNFVTGEATGGSFTYNGWAAAYTDNSPANYTGTAAPGFSPSTANGATVTGGYSATVDFTGAQPGYYSFTYNVTSGGCSASSNFVVRVVESPCAGGDGSTTTCVPLAGTTVIDVDALLTSAPCGSADATGTWTTFSTPPGASGYTFNSTGPNASFTVTTSTTSGTYVFRYTVQYSSNPSFPASGECTNCNDDTADVTIIVNPTPSAGTANNQTVCN